VVEALSTKANSCPSSVPEPVTFHERAPPRRVGRVDVVVLPQPVERERHREDEEHRHDVRADRRRYAEQPAEEDERAEVRRHRETPLPRDRPAERGRIRRALEPGRPEIDEKERRQLHKKMEEIKLKVENEMREERERASKNAQNIYESASIVPPDEEYNIYFILKCIVPINVRYGSYYGNKSIIIPIHNVDNEIKSLQYIYSDEEGIHKRFLSGGEKKGNFFCIGELRNFSTIYVVEGYATAVTIHDATKNTVVIAFDSGNLKPVIQSILYKYPFVKIIISADNDHEKATNTGMTKAIEASKLGCQVMLPPSIEGVSDFNDLYQKKGLDTVKKSLNVFNNQKRIDNPYDTFTLDCLPDLVKYYIKKLSSLCQSHPILILNSFLGQSSAFFKRKVYLPKYLHFQRDVYTNFWSLSIFESGGGKTTAQVLGSTLARKESARIYGEIFMLDQQMPPSNKEEKIKLERQRLNISVENPILPNKTTSEGLLEHLADGHQGVIYSGEFGAWLLNLEKNFNADLKSIFTEFYDVPESFYYQRAQGGINVRYPFINISGVSTLDWIKSYINPEDVTSGFFARFLIFTPPSNENIPAALPESNLNYPYKEESEIKYIYDEIEDNHVYEFSDSSRTTFDSVSR